MSAASPAPDDFASYLEMDRAPMDADALAEEPNEPLELELGAIPVTAGWLAEARARINAADTKAALNAVCAGFLAYPEAHKAQIRPIRDARWTAIEAATQPARSMSPALGVAVAAATVAATPAPVLTAVSMAAPVLTAPDGRPMVAGWRKIVGGPHAGAWGVCVEHMQYGVAIEPPQAGDVVLVNRAKGGSQPKRITGIVRTEGTRGGFSICTVADPTPGACATIARPRTAQAAPVAAPMPPMSEWAVTRLGRIRGLLGSDAHKLDAAVGAMPTARLHAWCELLTDLSLDDAMARVRADLGFPGATAAAPVEEDEAPSAVGAALGSEFSAIAAEAAANAAVPDLGAQSTMGASSNAGRRLGIGFSTPEQYLQALRNGGLQPATRAEYLRHVRTAGLAFDETTIPPANDAAAALPVGAGIQHTATGPSYFDQPRAARQGFKVGQAAQEVRSGAALLRQGDLIGGALVGGAGRDFSWAGSGEVKRADLLAALAEIGREGDAPAAKNAHAQAGRAVGALRNEGYDVHAVQGDERRGLPRNVAHRYIVGRVNSTGAGTATDEYGRRVLVVDLHRDDTLHFDRPGTLAEGVKADFEARCATDVYISADLTAWLQRTLRNVHGATRFGVGWYVPAGQGEAAERLTRAVGKIWGDSWRHGMPVAACSHLYEGLIEGLADEVAKIEAEWAGAQEKAREAHKLQVGTRGAAGILARLTETAERVRGYAVLLGDEAVTGLRTRIATMDAEIRPLVDDTSARASMLEFS